MNAESNVRATSVRLSALAARTRQTARTDFGTVMRNGLIRAGNVVADGLQRAAPFVPGGAIISAALAGGNSAAQLANRGGVGLSGGVALNGGGVYGTAVSGLTAGGTGPAGNGVVPVGQFGTDGVLGIPGQSPGLGTNVAGGATGGATAASTDAFNQMMAATRQMTEFQASFNLQYLQLQQNIQADTRQFNLISNIMKTKHDAAKNALNNVR